MIESFTRGAAIEQSAAAGPAAQIKKRFGGNVVGPMDRLYDEACASGTGRSRSIPPPLAMSVS